jgi:hypothetical protein
MAQFTERRRCFGQALQGHRHGEDGERQAPAFETAQHAPQAGTRAVLVQRFHAHVAHWKGLCIDDLGEKRFRGRIPMQHAILPAFFVIQYELHGDPCGIRPARMRWCASVTGEITRIMVRGVDAVHGVPASIPRA